MHGPIYNTYRLFIVNPVISTKSKATTQPHSTTKRHISIAFIKTRAIILLLRIYNFMCFMLEGENVCISGEGVGS